MKGIKEAQMGIITVLALMLVSIKRRLPETRRLSSGITTLTLAGIILLVAAGGASAATQITSCNFPADGTGGETYYYLGADLHCGVLGAGAYGVKVTASNVIIDGRGYSISATVNNVVCQSTTETNPKGGVCGILVEGKRNNITIEDIEVKDFCTGICIQGTNSFNRATDVTVINCSIHDNGVPGALATTGETNGIHMVFANDCTITKNNIVETNRGGASICDCGSGGNGIFMYTANDNNITCNNFCNNEKAGIFMKKGSSSNKIQYNNASRNGHSGVCIRCKSSNDNKIEYNNASYNKGTGIFIRGQRNIAKYNTVLNNMNGSWYATGNCGAGDPSYEVTAFGVGIKGAAQTVNAELYNNAICGNVWDVYDPKIGGGFTGDDNTGDTSGAYRDASAPAPPGHPFVYTCNGKIPVYFDFDGDTHYSAASCTCGNVLGVGCNPGLFNWSHANMLNGTSPPICWLTPGDDTNDCQWYGDFDLNTTDEWVCWPDNCTICYNVTNLGSSTAPAGHTTALYVDGNSAATDTVPVALAPGAIHTGCFDSYTWTYTSPSDTIMVCADDTNAVAETDETNNCLTETWVCGDVDGDGLVTVFDAYLVSTNDIWTTEWASDVDCDDYITVFDAYLISTNTLNCCCG